MTTLDIGTYMLIWVRLCTWLKSHGGGPGKPAPADNASPSHQAQRISTTMPTGDEAVGAGRISFRRAFRSAVLAIPPVRRLYNRAANAAQRIEVLEADNRELRLQIGAAGGVVPQATALTISVHRTTGHVIRISPAQFDAFEFRSGDTLTSRPHSGRQVAPARRTGTIHILGSVPTWDCEFPPKINLVSFRGFSVPEHLLALTGAGFNSSQAIGRAAHRELFEVHGARSRHDLRPHRVGIGRDAFQLLDIIGSQGRYMGIARPA